MRVPEFTMQTFWNKFRVRGTPNPRAELNAWEMGVDYARKLQYTRAGKSWAGYEKAKLAEQDKIADRVLKLGDSLQDSSRLRVAWVRGFWAGWAEFVARSRPPAVR